MKLDINYFGNLGSNYGKKEDNFIIHQLLSIINLINEMIFYKMLLVIKI